MSIYTGRKKEKAVADYLYYNRGFDILKEDTWGPADIVAQKGKRKWAIQVKYTRKTEIDSSRLSESEKKRLIRYAEKINATPVLCLVSGNYAWFESVKTGKLLMRAVGTIT